eukprot:CAMPEP_0169144198 /NCGR_PEP_ID=MMETSP1015-20121227/46097_1 /TAXON_ID=342587 /ORGANISM="Karlodinium micrum, Strain CCMP2283" /LENGTH=102 /DNA_ID=CAMNT_0009211399 /DNA_START=244 /DNA_END=549 /DNA_ORIENTATION=+
MWLSAHDLTPEAPQLQHQEVCHLEEQQTVDFCDHSEFDEETERYYLGEETPAIPMAIAAPTFQDRHLLEVLRGLAPSQPKVQDRAKQLELRLDFAQFLSICP